MISVVDADGRFQYQSPSLERILGYAPEETIGDTAWEYIHPDDREDTIEIFEAWMASAEAEGSIEYRARHADGSWRWFEARGSRQFDNPAVEGYVINSRDITSRKERNQKLARTRDLMSSMEQLATVGAWEYDPDTEKLRTTRGMSRIYGVDSDPDLTLKEGFELFHPDDRERLRDRFEECLETGHPYEMDVWAVSEGEKRWLTAVGERVQDNRNGSVVRGYVQDVTDRKTREQQLTELNKTTQRLSRASSRQEIAEIGVEAARDVLGLQANSLHFATADETELPPAAQTEGSVSLIGEAPVLPVADSIAGRVYQRGEPAAIEDIQQDPDSYNPDSVLRGHLYLPIDDEGVLIAGSAEVAAFDGTEITLGELLAGNLAAALDRIEREEMAKQRQERLSLFFEESPIGAIQWDETFRFDRLNEQAQEILGYTETDLRGEPWERIVADSDRGQVGNVVEQLLETDGGTHVINKNITKSGEVRVCEWHNRAVTGSDGEVRSIFSKSYDVTDHERRRQQLEEYATVLNTLSDAVYVLDEDGRFTYVNDEFVKLTDYDRERVVGNTPSLIKDAEAVETAEQQLRRLLSEEGPETVTFEVTIQPRDSDPVVCEDRMRVLPYDGDSFDGSVGTIRDVTEHKEHAQGLERQNDRLEEFASVVSHGLRTPLGRVRGRIELAAEECDCPHLTDAIDALDRGEELIDDLLTLARQGETVGEQASVDLVGITEDVWQTTDTERATLSFEDQQVIDADRSRLQQLLGNLFTNAIEHGGPDVTVRIGAIEDGFYVEDTGPGVPEANREEIFEAGYSTTESGTGFGLRIVKQVATAHGWTVRVTDAPSGGARFEFTGLSRRTSRGLTRGESQRSRPNPRPRLNRIGRLNHKRVLIPDERDDPETKN